MLKRSKGKIVKTVKTLNVTTVITQKISDGQNTKKFQTVKTPKWAKHKNFKTVKTQKNKI